MSIKSFFQSIEEFIFGKYTFLLASLILMIILMPMSDNTGDTFASTVVLSVIFIGSIYSIIQNKKFLFVSILLVIASFIINWLLELSPKSDLLHWMFLVQPIFFVYVTILIVLNILEAKRITIDIIFGSACGYLLIGVTWAMIFEFLVMMDPNAFSIPSQFITQSDVSYLSFTTISTLGYGDITPNAPIAKAFCVLEAIIGLFYVSTLVARLVALQVTHSNKN